VSDDVAQQGSLEDLLGVDSSCDAFEQLWQHGQRPEIEDHLSSVTEALRPLLVEELIRTELEWRFRAGESPAAAEYSSRFPGCSATIEAWLAEANSAAKLAQNATTGDTQPAEVSRTLLQHGDRPTDTA
jgi:hypothetical protein